MKSISKNMFINKLNDIVDEYMKGCFWSPAICACEINEYL